MCVVGIESISCPVTPNGTATEKRTSPAADKNSIDPFFEIGGQEGNLDNKTGDYTDDDGNGNKKKERSTVGFSQNRDIVALVRENLLYVECIRYRVNILLI